jgi:DNA-binding LacI/PurR family transcriptional regulator
LRKDSKALAGRRTTIYDIARLADTSASAVSSVLNGSWQKRRISKRLAEKVMQIAEHEGYAANTQASLLRRARSNIVGMIVPKYDNRYFGAIAEQFEAIARARGLFPVVTCTQREPALEVEAAKELISFQAECLIATGATDPDRLTALCRAAGVLSINLDLPGKAAVSVISDNYGGARDLTALILDRCREVGYEGPLHFVGGRASDHNTAARLRGFLDVHRERGLPMPDENVLVPGYSADRAERAMKGLPPRDAMGIFVNSTISLEGVVRWSQGLSEAARQALRYGCFDYDPFAALLPSNVGMVQQDIAGMLTTAFDIMDTGRHPLEPVLIPCVLKPRESAAQTDAAIR